MPTFSQVLAVFLGGGLGSVCRFAVSWAIPRAAFPWSTLVVNVLGGLLIGMLFSALGEGSTARFWLMVGFLGGFTTFSAFSIETIRLAEEGRLDLAGAYIVVTLLLGLGATWAGRFLTRSEGA